jgi:LL-H family phage holin
MNVNEIVGSAVVTIVGAATTWLITAGALWLAKHVSKDKLALGMTIAGIAVQAVEQIASRTGWGGTDKFSAAKSQVVALAKQAGITLTDAQITSLIESAVHELKLNTELLVPPATPPDPDDERAVSRLP